MMKESNETAADLSSLVDIRDVTVDRSLPVEDRIRSYVEQVKNPYCFRVGDVKVRVSFASDGRTLNDSFTDMLASL